MSINLYCVYKSQKSEKCDVMDRLPLEEWMPCLSITKMECELYYLLQHKINLVRYQRKMAFCQSTSYTWPLLRPTNLPTCRTRYQ